MAILNKTIVENHNATASFDYIVPNTHHFKNFTIEATFSTPMGYPASENDAELLLQDGELDTVDGSGTTFETINGALVKVADASDHAKIRMVDLATQNAKIVYTPNSANAGVLSINITFQT